jgi:hypothetical protein
MSDYLSKEQEITDEYEKLEIERDIYLHKNLSEHRTILDDLYQKIINCFVNKKNLYKKHIEQLQKENAEYKDKLDSLQAVHDLVLSENESVLSNCELQTKFEIKEKVIEIIENDNGFEVDYYIERVKNDIIKRIKEL